ncbi:MAG TPA: hypothetical protein PKD09_06035, partial [Aggregatilinea sp.]|uniref:hypothetical protein n=1 Tax=Aggregatilinea sp. TaxID=2806333 RepID=UPI002C6191FF
MSKKLISMFLLLTLLVPVGIGGSVIAQDDDLLFVAINKSADQQYFIDLQSAFSDATEGFGGEARTFD